MSLPQWIVVASWAALFLYSGARWAMAREGRGEQGRRTAPAAMAGMALEVIGLWAVFIFPHLCVTPGPVSQWSSAAAAAAAVWFGCAAGAHLGKQLRVQAVVTADHRLITTGPYRVVRHPIYLSLLVLFFASTFAFACKEALVIALPLFLAGTEIRVRAEDKLLAAHFGEEFARYRNRVKAYLPGIR